MATRKRKRSRRDVNLEKIENRIFDIEESSPYVRILIYGKNGKGKTRLAASFPNALIIDVNEEGTRSARQFKGTKVFEVKDWEDITAIYWYLQRGGHNFESVAIDTISQLNDMALRRALKEKAERDPNVDPKQPTKRDYGKSKELMTNILLMFRNLPMHVIFVATERTEGDPEEGEEIVHLPQVQAGVRPTAMGSVGIIGRVFQKEVKLKGKKNRRKTKWVTCMLVGPHEEYESKDRTADSGILGRIAVNPTGKMIIDSWEAAPPGEE